MKKFTVEEIKNYLAKQDSFGDAIFFLTEESIEEANNEILVSEVLADDDSWVEKAAKDNETEPYTEGDF